MQISSIRNNPASAFKPMMEGKLLANHFPIKNPLDFLAVLVTPAGLPPLIPNAPMTLLEHLLHNFDLLNRLKNQIKRISVFFLIM